MAQNGLGGLVSLVLAGSIWADVAGIVNQVSEATYRSYMEHDLYTRTGHNRGPAGAEHDLARASLQ